MFLGKQNLLHLLPAACKENEYTGMEDVNALIVVVCISVCEYDS